MNEENVTIFRSYLRIPLNLEPFVFTIHAEGMWLTQNTLWFRPRYDSLIPASMRRSRSGQKVAVQSSSTSWDDYQANSALARIA